jgi:hypothetical protein
MKKICSTVFRMHYAIFSGNLAPIGENSSPQRFFGFGWGKITNTTLKGSVYRRASLFRPFSPFVNR